MKTILTTLALSLTLLACGADTPAKPYPLKTCVVSGEELGSMGKPVVITHDGVEVQLCCKNCIKKFEANPAKYLAKLPKK